MNSNLIKLVSFVTVPSLYLYHLNRQNNAHAFSNDKEPKINNDKLLTNNESSSQSILNQNRNLSIHIPVSMLEKSKNEVESLIEAFRVISNAPGVVCGVSYKGVELFAFGQGLADIDTRSKCSDDTIMRIGSVSKPITMFLLGKLLEQKKLDLDLPISHYLNEDKWPVKYFEKKKVDITLRQLVSHLSDIRHYKNDDDDMNKSRLNDDLEHKPGDKYLYTTFGYTLISAVIQSVLEKDQKFEAELIKSIKDEIRMLSTYIDTNEAIILNRAKFYYKDKIAGGGLLSNVHDLLKFGNAMLYSYKTENGILKQETLKQFWTPNELTKQYGMGFQISDNSLMKYKGLKRMSFNNMVYHGGGAAGSVCVLSIYPDEEIVIAILVNLYNCPGLLNLSTSIAKSIYHNLEANG